MQAVKSENIYLPEINNRLEKINQQVRHVSRSLQIDANQEMLVLGNGDRLDLNIPLNELFYLVSDRTLDHDRYPSFSSLKMKIINFQEIPAESKLSINHKRELCQFLEEAIGNVGKYAGSATRLQLLGKVEGNLYRLSIEDNGQSKISSRVGEGTQQAKRLAASLKGRFDRSQNISAAGVICYLEWSFRRK